MLDQIVERGLIAAAVGFLVLAAWSDLRARQIPNWISAALATVAGLRLALAGDPAVAALAIGIAAAVFAPLALAFAHGRVGGGDVKLLTAAVLVAGPAGTPTMLTVTVLVGGAMALVALQPAVRAALNQLTGHRFAQPGLPYGVAIAGGTGLTLLQQFPNPTA